MRLAVLLLLLAYAGKAQSHERWANGSAIPAWVKSSCCGPADANLLDISQIHDVKGGYQIEGLDNIVPEDRTFDSQDGQVWAFYTPGTPKAFVHCLFIPRSF